MTNEDLALAIQDGATELYSVLWEQVSRWVEIRAKRYAQQLYDCGKRIDPEDFYKDLMQSAYFAVVEAVKIFDPAKRFKFTTFLERPMRREFRRTAGILTSKRDGLDFALDINAPIGDDKSDTFADLVADPRNDIPNCEESIYLWELRDALEDVLWTLSDRERQTLVGWYFYGVSYTEQAEQQNVTRGCIANIAVQAMNKIRSDRQSMEKLAEFMPSLDFDPYKYTSYSAWKQNESVQNRYLIYTENVRQLLI